MRMTRTLMLVAVAMATLFMGKAATAAPLAPVSHDMRHLALAARACTFASGMQERLLVCLPKHWILHSTGKTPGAC